MCKSQPSGQFVIGQKSSIQVDALFDQSQITKCGLIYA